MVQPQIINSIKQAEGICGGFSEPSKIPTYCYNLPATACHVGATLVDKPNSICNGCYGLKGWYVMDWVENAQYRRLESLVDRRWTDALVFMIKHYNCAFFRWHDTGDLQGLWHLQRIFEVCYRTPGTYHWLPTKEHHIIKEFRKLGIPKPVNLNIQLSAFYIDEDPPVELAKQLHVSASGVSKENWNCPASLKTVKVDSGRGEIRHGYCGSCRNCWDETKTVIFRLH